MWTNEFGARCVPQCMLLASHRTCSPDQRSNTGDRRSELWITNDKLLTFLQDLHLSVLSLHLRHQLMFSFLLHLFLLLFFSVLLSFSLFLTVSVSLFLFVFDGVFCRRKKDIRRLKEAQTFTDVTGFSRCRVWTLRHTTAWILLRHKGESSWTFLQLPAQILN